MIHKSFDNANQSKPQHKHNQLGWFWSTEETKPVFWQTEHTAQIFRLHQNTSWKRIKKRWILHRS